MDECSCWKRFFRWKRENGKRESIYCERLQKISSTALHSRKQLSSALKYLVK